MSTTIEIPTIDEFLRTMRKVQVECPEVAESHGHPVPTPEEFDRIDELVREYEREQPHLVAPDPSLPDHDNRDVIRLQQSYWWEQARQRVVGS